jgi:hypothetical protein
VARRLPAERTAVRWTLLGLGVLFVAYAVLVRKNAVFAAVPVFAMLVLAARRAPGRRIWVVSTLALVLGVAVPAAAISSLAQPLKTGQSSQIMLDDLLHVPRTSELRSAAVSPDLRDRLVASKKQCARIHSLSDTYWTCYRIGPGGLAADADEITSLWLSEMTHHVPGYVQYRLQLFSGLLFNGRNEYQAGTLANDLGLKVSHPRLEAALRNYVLGVARDLPPLFAGWLWLAVAIVLSFRPGEGRFSMPVRALGVSSAAYVLGYLPIMPATSTGRRSPARSGSSSCGWVGSSPLHGPTTASARSAV